MLEETIGLFKAPKAILRKGKQLLFGTKEIVGMIADPKLSQSYYPSENRKSKLRILNDLLSWLFRHREVNSYYYVYGFDRRQGVDMDNYLPYRAFRKIRNHKNLHPSDSASYNYLCILRDKFVFSQFVSSLGFPTPRNLAILDRRSITWLDQMRTTPLDELLRDKGLYFDAFCKGLAGINGRGVFPLRLHNSKLSVNGEEITLDQLKDRLNGQCLIQERVQQHGKMRELHPHSVNTIRLVTFNNGGDVQVFSAGLRIGTKGRSLDNWTAGGILVGIDLESGRVREEGFYKPGYGGRVGRHPQTDVPFSGFEIPYFNDALELAKGLHGYLYGIHSVGWDIAITEAGPIIIEGNDDWDGAVPMALEKNFKQRFLHMYRA